MAIFPEFLPGERLAIRVWETVEKLGTGLLSPLQIRRESKARREVRRLELLEDAQTQRDIQDIIAGKTNSDIAGYIGSDFLPLKREPYLYSPNDPTEPKSASTLGPPSLLKNAYLSARSDEVRRLANLRSVTAMAEDEAENIGSEGSDSANADASVSDDWLAQWKDGAQQVSAEEMQGLWAKLLAREVNRPGTYSLRALALLRTLSPGDARSIEQLGPFTNQFGYIVRPNSKNKYTPLLYGNLLRFEEMGIVTGIHGAGITWSQHFEAWPPDKTDDDTEVPHLITMSFQKKAVLILKRRPGLADSFLKIGAYALTKAGHEIMTLGQFEVNETYLDEIAHDFLRGGKVTVRTATWKDYASGTVENMREIVESTPHMGGEAAPT